MTALLTRRFGRSLWRFKFRWRIKVLLARTLRLLSRKSAEEMENTLEWLQNYR